MTLDRIHAPMPTRFPLFAPIACVLGALVAGGCSDGAGRDSAATAIVKERRDNYRRMGDAYKALKETIETGNPDMTLVTRSMRLIRDTGAGQAALFPPGSGQSSGARTRALDGVWTEPALFARRQRDFLAAADAVLATERVELGHAFEALTEACLDCHRDFREKR